MAIRFENILRKVGGRGRWQWQTFAVVYLTAIAGSLFNLVTVFMLFTPEHWCKIPGVDFHNLSIPESRNWTTERILDYAIPYSVDKGYSGCEIYDRNYSGVFQEQWTPDSDEGQYGVASCDTWTYNTTDFKNTVVTQFNLVCGSSYLVSYAKTAYMVGALIGGVIWGLVSDTFGRRRTAFVGVILLTTFGLLTSASFDHFSFIATRFFVGLGNTAVFSSHYLILVEMVDPTIRSVFQMVYMSIHIITLMILPTLATYITSWSYLNLAIGIPSFIIFVAYWWVPESPRWYIVKGRFEDAYLILKKIADVNDEYVEKDEIMHMIFQCHRTEMMSLDISLRRNALWLLYDLFCRKEMRKLSFIIVCIWGISGFVYYGFVYNVPPLGGTIFMTLFMSGITEVPTYLIGSVMAQFMRRRIGISISFLLGGAASLSCLFIPIDRTWMTASTVFAGKFFISITYCLLYVYTAESFPTRHRHLAIGLASTCARIGSILAPFAVDLVANNTAPFMAAFQNASKGGIMMMIFALDSLVAGLLCFLLPETLNRALPETIDDISKLAELKMKTIDRELS